MGRRGLVAGSLAGIVLALGVLSAAPAPDDELCSVLGSEQSRLLSGAGRTALMRMCGELPPADLLRATPSHTELVSPESAAASADVQVNAIPDTLGPATTQSEVTLAETGGTLVAGWNDSSSVIFLSGNGYAVSTDGGASWEDRGALLPGPGIRFNEGDPWIRAHHATGNFYYATLATLAGTTRSILAVYTGATPGIAPDWPAVTNVTPGEPPDSFQDKDAMDVDNSGGPFDGRVYVCWRQFGGSDSIRLSINDTTGVDAPLAHRESFDLGGDYGSGQGCFVAVDQSSGDVYVGWEDYGYPLSIRVRRSPPGGLAFGPTRTVATLSEIGEYGACPFCPGYQTLNGFIRVFEFISSMAVNPVTRNLHAVYASAPDRPDQSDVFHSRCSPVGNDDVGACTTPFQLNSDATSNDQWHPYVHASASGTLATFWYDRRNDPENFEIDVYKRFSLDDGATWSADEKVTDVPFGVPPLCPNFDPVNSPCYMAEYNHITADASDRFFFVWGDNRNLVSGRPDPDVFTEVEQAPLPPGPTSIEVSKTASFDGRFVSGAIRITNVGDDTALISRLEDTLEAHFPKKRGSQPPVVPEGSSPGWFEVAEVPVGIPGFIAVGETREIEYSFDVCRAEEFAGANAMRNVVAVTLRNKPKNAPDTVVTRSEGFEPGTPECPVGPVLEDLSPCFANDVWEFEVTAGDSVFLEADTVDAATAADLCFFGSCDTGDFFSADDIFPCTFPPPAFSCPLATFVASADGTCTMNMQTCSSACADFDRAGYSLSVQRDGSFTNLTLIGDDQ